ncbi:hypothetical protein B0H13DRAFT_509284, partial [Mycena leptocephala]
QPLAVGFPVFFRIVDGRCTPPDFLSNLLFDSDHDVVMMSSLQPRPGSALLSPSAVEDVYPPPQTWIHGGWYTDPTLPPGWSTDWEDWDNLRLWTATIDGKLKIDQFQCVFDVPGTIEPLAYMVSTGGLFFVFTAGGAITILPTATSVFIAWSLRPHKNFCSMRCKREAIICQTWTSHFSSGPI